MMRRALLGGGLAVVLASAASADDRRDTDELARALKGRVAERTASCISTDTNTTPQQIGGTLLFRTGGELWRNDVVGRCPGLERGNDPLLIFERYGSQLCRNDRFRTLDRGSSIPGAYCRMGDFTRYVRPKG
jgi:hypothetical protein